jgi:hypothetical protein
VKHTRSKGPSLHRHYPASSVLWPSPTPAWSTALERDVDDHAGLPRYAEYPSNVPCPLPRRTGTGAFVDCFPIPCSLPSTVERSASTSMLFEACSGFTRVTARWIARRPRAAFVAGLRHGQSPAHTARQLPGQSTITCVEPPSTDTQRLRGALPPCASTCPPAISAMPIGPPPACSARPTRSAP